MLKSLLLLLISSLCIFAEESIKCPECNGNGEVPCVAHCKDGKVVCPGKCLKLEVGKWFLGKENIRWIDIGGWLVSERHLGQIATYENKTLKIIDCPICNKTRVVACKQCGGKSKIICPACAGTKLVEPALYDKYKRTKMEKLGYKNFSIEGTGNVYGKIVAKMGGKVFLDLEDGKKLEVTEDKLTEVVNKE